MGDATSAKLQQQFKASFLGSSSKSQEDAWQDPIQEKERRSARPWKVTGPSHQSKDMTKESVPIQGRARNE